MFRTSVGGRKRRPGSLGAAFVVSLLATTGLGAVGQPMSASALAPNDPGCRTGTGPTGNIVFHDSCDGRGFIPDVASADAESQRIAFAMWKSVMQFCIEHPNGASLKAAGYKQDPNDNHWVRSGFTAPSTTQAVIEHAKYPSSAPVGGNMNGPNSTVGVVWSTDWSKLNGIGYVGTIPPVHTHEHNLGAGGEMLHGWCMPTIEESFGFDWPKDEDRATTAQLEAALAKAEAGGIAAVSSQMNGNVPASSTKAKPSAVSNSVANTKVAKSETIHKAHDNVSTGSKLVKVTPTETPAQSSAVTELAMTGVDTRLLLSIAFALLSAGLGCLYLIDSRRLSRVP